MDKLLTIIIPTYNMEKYIRHCLDSLIVEDEMFFNQLEILVVIDGGKDASSRIAHEYENNYPGVIRTIDKENGNYGSCINRGLKEAKGEYFKILDADDCFDKNGLIALMKALQICNADLCVTSYSTINEDGETTGSIRVPKNLEGKVLKGDDILWTKDLPLLLLSMHAFCIKRSVLINNNYVQQEGISYTDTEYNYFCLLFSNNICFYDFIVYKYLLGREGQTVSPEASIKNSSNYWKVANRLIQDFSERKELTTSRKENVLIPIMKVVTCFFNTELVVKKPKMIDKLHLKSILDVCDRCNIDVNNIDYHGVRYVSIYRKTGFSFHWLYRMVEKIKILSHRSLM